MVEGILQGKTSLKKRKYLCFSIHIIYRHGMVSEKYFKAKCASEWCVFCIENRVLTRDNKLCLCLTLPHGAT